MAKILATQIGETGQDLGRFRRRECDVLDLPLPSFGAETAPALGPMIPVKRRPADSTDSTDCCPRTLFRSTRGAPMLPSLWHAWLVAFAVRGPMR